MATDDVGGEDQRALSGDVTSPTESDAAPKQTLNAHVGLYTWADFLDEYESNGDVESLYRNGSRTQRDVPGTSRWEDDDGSTPTPTRADWDHVGLDPEEYLDYHPVGAAAFADDRGMHAENLSE